MNTNDKMVRSAFLFNLDNIPISFVFQKTHRSSRKTNPSCFQIGARSWWSIELRTHLDSRQLLCNHRISSIVQADTTLSQGKKASNTDLALQHISAIYRLSILIIKRYLNFEIFQEWILTIISISRFITSRLCALNRRGIDSDILFVKVYTGEIEKSFIWVKR